MRKYLIYGSLGLLSIGWINGCDTFHSARTDTTTPRSGVVPTGCSACQAGSSDAKSKVAAVKTTNDAPPAVAKEGMESVAISPPVVASNRPAPPAALPENPRESLKPQAVAPPLPPPSPSVLEFPPMPEKAIAEDEAPAVPPVESRVLPPPPLPTIAPLPPIAPEPMANTIEVAPRTVKEKTSVAQKAEVRPGQAEQFKSVTGKVQVYRKTWRLRYAPIDQIDIYGGVVVLDGGAELSNLRDGQHVRVRGELIPPAEPNGTAHYRVASIETLD